MCGNTFIAYKGPLTKYAVNSSYKFMRLPIMTKISAVDLASGQMFFGFLQPPVSLEVLSGTPPLTTDNNCIRQWLQLGCNMASRRADFAIFVPHLPPVMHLIDVIVPALPGIFSPWEIWKGQYGRKDICKWRRVMQTHKEAFITLSFLSNPTLLGSVWRRMIY